MNLERGMVMSKTIWKNKDLIDVSILIKDGTHGTHKDVPDGIPLLSAKDIKNGALEIPFYCRKITLDDYKQIHTTYEIAKDDLLLTIVGTIGRVAIVTNTFNKFTFQRSVAIIRLNKHQILPTYAFHYFQSEKFQRVLLRKESASAQGGVYLGELGKTKIHFPEDIKEQSNIAQILTTCDKVIEQTEAAINKYKAIKQGMLHDLFTRGLDENGKLRPTPSEAPDLYKESELGLIPKDWEVHTLGECCKTPCSYGINAPAVNYNSRLPLYLRITDITENGAYNKNDRKCVDAPTAHQYVLNEGDIVFARTGATVGKTYLYNSQDGILIYAGFLIKFSPNKNILDSYLLKSYTETDSYWNWVNTYSQRSGQPGINGNEYSSLLLPCPKIEEQNKITTIFASMDQKIQGEKILLNKQKLVKKSLMKILLNNN